MSGDLPLSIRIFCPGIPVIRNGLVGVVHKSLRMPLLGETISAMYFLAKISHAYSKELIRKVLLLRKAHLCLTM